MTRTTPSPTKAESISAATTDQLLTAVGSVVRALAAATQRQTAADILTELRRRGLDWDRILEEADLSPDLIIDQVGSVLPEEETEGLKGRASSD